MQAQTTPRPQYPAVIRLGDLVLGPNPRRGNNPASVEMLESIKQKGVIQPVLARPINDGKFELRAGFTRYNLAKLAHGEDYPLPMHVLEMDDSEAEEFSLVENVHRGDMSPAEEAESASRILARCGGNRDDAARRLGWTRSTFDKRLALMNAVEEVRDALVNSQILLGHAELLAAISKDKQAKVLQVVLAAPNMPTVAELKAQIASIAMKLGEAIFVKDECAGCQNNSGNQGALFGEAIDSGYCTNRECFERKTEGALEAKKESLKDEFPEIRIVRPGENFTVIKLVSDGAAGVGEEQAKACKSCGKYGAAISGVPGKMGNVYKGLCFDSACNAEKVKARQALEGAVEKAAEEAAKAATSKGENPEKAVKAAKEAVKKEQAAKAPAKVQDSSRVKEYRLKTWRRALARQLARDPALNDIVLLATALSGNGGKFNGPKLQAVFEQVTKQKSPSLSIVDAMKQVAETADNVRSVIRTAIAASVAEGVDEYVLTSMVAHCNTNLSECWKVCDEYLNLLTKSEMEVVAEQIGLKGRLDEKAFAKVFAGKKDEIVKKFLTVEGFDYAGKIPLNMSWSKS